MLRTWMKWLLLGEMFWNSRFKWWHMINLMINHDTSSGYKLMCVSPNISGTWNEDYVMENHSLIRFSTSTLDTWNSWWCIFAAVLLQLWKSFQDITDIAMQYFCQDQFLHNDSSIPAARGKGVCDILAMPLGSIRVLFWVQTWHWHKLRYSQVIWCLFLTKVHFQVPDLILHTPTLLDLKHQISTTGGYVFVPLLLVEWARWPVQCRFMSFWKSNQRCC